MYCTNSTSSLIFIKALDPRSLSLLLKILIMHHTHHNRATITMSASEDAICGQLGYRINTIPTGEYLDKSWRANPMPWRVLPEHKI